jgi:hypothetical protein
MTRTRWLQKWFACLFVILGLAGMLLTSITQADDTKNIDDQKAKQKSAQAATEEVIQRIGTMLRVMEYYQPDKTQQHKTLEKVAHTLVSLSREQMEEVLKALDKAAAAGEGDKSAKELEEAHGRHVEIMQSLRELLAEHYRVNSLDQLAEKLDKLARSQLELALHITKIYEELDDRFNPGAGGIGGQTLAATRARNQEFLQLDVEQGNLHKELKDALAKAAKLKKTLPAEQQEALDNLAQAAAASKVLLTMDRASVTINQMRYQSLAVQTDGLPVTILYQRKAADDIKDLAGLLRNPRDVLASLRMAKDYLDDAISLEEQLRETTKRIAEPKALPDLPSKPAPDFVNPPQQFGRGFGAKGGGGRMGNAGPMFDNRGKELSDQQARIALDTRDATSSLKPVARDLAVAVESTDLTMKTAEQSLRKAQLAESIPSQDRALQALKDTRAKVLDLIAKAETKKLDTLEALKTLADQVDKLLKDQIATREQTQKAETAKQPNQLPFLASKQANLSLQTDMLQATPVPLKNETRDALDKAARAMDKATEDLQKKQADPAVANQDDAVKGLEDAKKSLAEQMAEIEKRREDIAKLQEAAEKLDKLTKDEGKIADSAKNAQEKEKADTRDLAAKQDKLTPEAKNLAKEIDKAAPKASDKIQQGAEKMEAAKKELDKNQAKPGAQEADKAVDKLKEAQQELAKKLDDLKGKELADQAALQKKDPTAALQQLQKAIEQTQQAMRESKNAQNEKMQNELAKLQRELAEDARDQTFDKASVPAKEAANNLDYGDLKKALNDQQKALDRFLEDKRQADSAKLNAKAQQPGEKQTPAESKAGDPAAKPQGNAKLGERDLAKAKQGEPQDAKNAGESKPADQAPMPATAKKGEGEGEGKSGEAKQGQDPGADEPSGGEAKSGAKAGQGKAKQGQPAAAKAKADQQAAQGDAKSGPPAEGAGPLAQRQKELMDMTMQLAQQQAKDGQMAQRANQGAMQALGQAMASSPKGSQQQMQKAANQLGKAGQQLADGSPGQAMQSQNKALQQMLKSMQQTQGAQKMAQGQQPGQKGQGQQPGQEPGQGDEPGQGQKGQKGQGQKQNGQGQKNQNQGNAQERNENQANGNRQADGKVDNARSLLNDVTGEDTFLKLPPRQRELIRQALAGELPPEFAAQIQQYYLNISRGRSGMGPPPKQ